MFFRSTFSAVLISMVLVTALTAMGARIFECCETILEDRDVVAAWRRVAVSVRDTGCDISCRTWTAAAAALWKASAMTEGWMPLASSLSAAPSKLPAITTTDVVPSPASTSCAADKSTSIFAEGCMTAMLLSIVFPSFVTTSESVIWMRGSMKRQLTYSLPPSRLNHFIRTSGTKRCSNGIGNSYRWLVLFVQEGIRSPIKACKSLAPRTPRSTYLWPQQCLLFSQPSASPCPACGISYCPQGSDLAASHLERSIAGISSSLRDSHFNV